MLMSCNVVGLIAQDKSSRKKKNINARFESKSSPVDVSCRDTRGRIA